jgi:large subunit ribosomal protein L17
MALYRKLNREVRVRRSILSSLVKDVLTCGHVDTTDARAKEAKKFVDKMITYAKKGDLTSRRQALAFLNNDKELTKKLFDEIAPAYKDRNGGYTRIIKLGERQGDDALIVRLELV